MPTFRRGFGPISAAAVNATEKRLGVELPADYKRFLRTTNGGCPTPEGFVVPERGPALVAILYGVRSERTSLDLEFEQTGRGPSRRVRRRGAARVGLPRSGGRWRPAGGPDTEATSALGGNPPRRGPGLERECRAVAVLPPRGLRAGSRGRGGTAAGRRVPSGQPRGPRLAHGILVAVRQGEPPRHLTAS